MPAHLTLDAYLQALRSSTQAFRALAERAGPRSTVPTCPGWDVHDLITHQGSVHRWATTNLLGQPERRTQDHADGLATPDPLTWFDQGADVLQQTLRQAPDDIEALVFLADAPPARTFWARRQAHETTIHAVDALASALGRFPASSEITDGQVPLSAVLAADGVDELLCGFLPAGRGRLRSAEPYTLLVETTDTRHAWTVQVSSQRPVTTVGRAEAPDATFSGSAFGVYLGLWNRGDELTVTGRGNRLTEWRSLAVV